MLVALFDGGPITALLMLGAVLLVQQVEGNVLYPWLFGKVASLHPLAILLTVSVGTLLLGIIGAVIAVPVVSFVYAFARTLREEYQAGTEPPPDSGQIHVLDEGPRVAFRRARDAIAKTGEIRVRHHPEAHDAHDADRPEGPGA